jgi:F-type H+-transporting ATPase subunit alpha
MITLQFEKPLPLVKQTKAKSVNKVLKRKSIKMDKKTCQNLLNKTGIVVSYIDTIVSLAGLRSVKSGEIVNIFNGSLVYNCLILNLEENLVKGIVFEKSPRIKPGLIAVNSGNLMVVPVNFDLLGRVLDPLGNPIDNKGLIKGDFVYNLVEQEAPTIIERTSVNESLETGLKIVDSLVPIGHGQRELIIGDAKTGKTAIAIDTILNQKGRSTICIYVAIGQKQSSVARIVRTLVEGNAMSYSIVVSATASDPASLQYIAPYSGCAIGEFFMRKGFKVLIVYDDLSKHAVSYRQLSLLLRRPPGREGYPGDVFYLHSRLLERAANLKDGGSLTALPIVETIQGDVSAYIPTNIISITDGQIFLETELFSKGIRPAVSPGLSVSRVGSAAQSKVMKKLAGSLKLELAQFRELEDFAKLGFSLDESTKRVLERGTRLTTLLIQKNGNPISVANQIVFLYSALNGFLENINLNKLALYEEEFNFFLNNSIFKLPFELGVRDSLETELVDYVLYSFIEQFLLNK